jgi:hypothetical protein
MVSTATPIRTAFLTGDPEVGTHPLDYAAGGFNLRTEPAEWNSAEPFFGSSAYAKEECGEAWRYKC